MHSHAMVIVRRAGRRVALPVQLVDKIVATPRLTPLADTPLIVAGLVNLHGTPLVVLDPFGAAPDARPPGVGTCLAIVRTGRRAFALLCDGVERVAELPDAAWQDLSALLPGIDYRAAGQPGSPELLVLRDPDGWLSDARHGDIEAALARQAASPSPGGPAQ